MIEKCGSEVRGWKRGGVTGGRAFKRPHRLLIVLARKQGRLVTHWNKREARNDCELEDKRSSLLFPSLSFCFVPGHRFLDLSWPGVLCSLRFDV
jgi:hypothetical protein